MDAHAHPNPPTCLSDSDLSLPSLKVGIAGHATALAHIAHCSECCARLARLAEDAPVEERVGRYLIVGNLGEGQYGRVMAAYDPELDRTIALKLLKPKCGTDGVSAMVREAQAMAKITHPNVVAIYDAGLSGPTAYVAMQRIDGAALRAWMEASQPALASSSRYSKRSWVRSPQPIAPASCIATSSPATFWSTRKATLFWPILASQPQD